MVVVQCVDENVESTLSCWIVEYAVDDNIDDFSDVYIKIRKQYGMGVTNLWDR